MIWLLAPSFSLEVAVPKNFPSDLGSNWSSWSVFWYPGVSTTKMKKTWKKHEKIFPQYLLEEHEKLSVASILFLLLSRELRDNNVIWLKLSRFSWYNTIYQLVSTLLLPDQSSLCFLLELNTRECSKTIFNGQPAIRNAFNISNNISLSPCKGHQIWATSSSPS